MTVTGDGLGVGVWDKEESRWREMYFGDKNEVFPVGQGS